MSEPSEAQVDIKSELEHIEDKIALVFEDIAIMKKYNSIWHPNADVRRSSSLADMLVVYMNGILRDVKTIRDELIKRNLLEETKE